MDNLTNKTIKQFYYDTDAGTLIITLLKTKNSKMCEWYGHMAGYGIINFLIGGEKVDNRSYKSTADYLATEFYDDIAQCVDDDITDYMGGHENPNMKGELKAMCKKFSDNMARIAREN